MKTEPVVTLHLDVHQAAFVGVSLLYFVLGALDAYFPIPSLPPEEIAVARAIAEDIADQLSHKED